MRRIALAAFVAAFLVVLSACSHATTAAHSGFTISLGRDGHEHCINEDTGEEVPLSYCQ